MVSAAWLYKRRELGAANAVEVGREPKRRAKRAPSANWEPMSSIWRQHRQETDVLDLTGIGGEGHVGMCVPYSVERALRVTCASYPRIPGRAPLSHALDASDWREQAERCCQVRARVVLRCGRAQVESDVYTVLRKPYPLLQLSPVFGGAARAVEA